MILSGSQKKEIFNKISQENKEECSGYHSDKM